MCCRHIVEAESYIKRFVTPYSLLGAANLIVLIIMPLFESERRLPFLAWFPFDVYRSTIRFYSIYVMQFACAVFAGGCNVSINMYIYSILVYFNFFLRLLNVRASRLGFASGFNEKYTKTPVKKLSFYRDTIECISFHLKIDKYVPHT